MGSTNSEIKKQKLEEEKRQKISVAVEFLGGENMELIEDTEKKMFLRKKGLTDDMIE